MNRRMRRMNVENNRSMYDIPFFRSLDKSIVLLFRKLGRRLSTGTRGILRFSRRLFTIRSMVILILLLTMVGSTASLSGCTDDPLAIVHSTETEFYYVSGICLSDTGTGAPTWVDWDLSSKVPNDAIAIVGIIKQNGSTQLNGVRENGSATDTTFSIVAWGVSTFYATKTEGTVAIFEAYENTADAQYYLVGYWK